MNTENKTMQEVYKNSSEDVRKILKNKFYNSELGLEIDKDKFKEYFLELLGSYKSIRFIDDNGDISKLPTKRYELLDESGLWLFDIDLNPNKMWFTYSWQIIYPKLQDRFGDDYSKINELIKDILDNITELKGLPVNWWDRKNKRGNL